MVPIIYPLTAYPKGYLVMMGRPRGGEWLDDEIVGLQHCGIHVVVSLLEPQESLEVALTHESDVCMQHGLTYRSFPIPDRGLPPSYKAMATLVEELHVQLLAHKGIAIHCRAGIGRSGLVAACLFVRCGFSPEEAVVVITRDRRVPIPDTTEQRQWIDQYAQYMNTNYNKDVTWL